VKPEKAPSEHRYEKSNRDDNPERAGILLTPCRIEIEKSINASNEEDELTPDVANLIAILQNNRSHGMSSVLRKRDDTVLHHCLEKQMTRDELVVSDRR
jgi:hypothetical protein